MRLLDVLIIGTLLFFLAPLVVGCASSPTEPETDGTILEAPVTKSECTELDILMALRPDHDVDMQAAKVRTMLNEGCPKNENK